jgi:hypothetical protein
MLNTIETQAAIENCRTLIDQINARLSVEEPSSMSHRQQSFCCILSLPLPLSKRRDKSRNTQADVALGGRFALR